MCLNIDKERTKKHSNQIKNKKCVFYKDFTFADKDYTTSNYDYVLCSYFTGVGIEPDTEIVEPLEFYIDVSNNTISGGVLHANVTQGSSEASSSEEICIPIIVESDDIIAFGNNDDVCFSKYEISKTSWKKIKSRIRKLNKRANRTL